MLSNSKVPVCDTSPKWQTQLFGLGAVTRCGLVRRIQAVAAHMALRAGIELSAVAAERVLTGVGLPAVLVAALHLRAEQRRTGCEIVYIGEGIRAGAGSDPVVNAHRGLAALMTQQTQVAVVIAPAPKAGLKRRGEGDAFTARRGATVSVTLVWQLVHVMPLPGASAMLMPLVRKKGTPSPAWHFTQPVVPPGITFVESQ